MVDIEELEHGDIVRIVSEWNEGCEAVGVTANMERFLGKTMTVDRITLSEDRDRSCALFVEDAMGWNWNRWMIEEIVEKQDDGTEINTEIFKAVLNG